MRCVDGNCYYDKNNEDEMFNVLDLGLGFNIVLLVELLYFEVDVE